MAQYPRLGYFSTPVASNGNQAAYICTQFTAVLRNRLPINLRGTDHIFPSRQKLVPAVKALPFPEPNHRKSVNVDYISFASNQYKSGSEYNVSHEHSDSQEERIQIIFVFYH